MHNTCTTIIHYCAVYNVYRARVFRTTYKTIVIMSGRVFTRRSDGEMGFHGGVVDDGSGGGNDD